MAAELEPLNLKMTVDTSGVAEALADAYDSTGRRLTAVEGLVQETIEGDARLGVLFGNATDSLAVAWEAVARDLARQVINAETEIAELDEAAGVKEDKAEEAAETDLDATKRSRDIWRTWYTKAATKRDALVLDLVAEEQAHCDTYIEAVRLSEELAGWQDSDGAEYRKATAAARLAAYEQIHRLTP